jgi:dihydroflavonol-4-reductase
MNTRIDASAALPGRPAGLSVVTGATGHIGNVLVRELRRLGRAVRVVVPPGEDVTPLDGLELELAAGDVRDRTALARAFRNADTVYHLAGIISISRRSRRLLDAVNVHGTRNVVQACLQNGVRRLVYTSSVHALVEPPAGVATCEPKRFEPESVIGAYGRSKARASLEVLAGVQQGLDAVLVFPSGVVGPFDHKGSDMGQLMIDFARRRLPAYLDGAYDFVDVRDVVSALIAAAERGRTGEGYVISGSVITVRELMALLERVTGVKAPRLVMPYWLAGLAATLSPVWYGLTRGRPRFTRYSLHVLRSNCLMDNRKARRELTFTPRPVEESVADAVRWFAAAGRIKLPALPS